MTTVVFKLIYNIYNLHIAREAGEIPPITGITLHAYFCHKKNIQEPWDAPMHLQEWFSENFQDSGQIHVTNEQTQFFETPNWL